MPEPPTNGLPRLAIFTGLCCAACLAAALLPGWAGLVAALAGTACAALVFTKCRLLLNRAAQQKCTLDEQLLQSQKLAAIGEVASGIAHEINNPLAIITQEAEWLAHLQNGLPQESPGLEDMQATLAGIQNQVSRCADITHSLLSLARRCDPILQPTDLNKLVEDMARLVEREAKPKNIALVRHYAPGLPKATLDPPLLRQAVLNLLVNAAQAIGRDGQVDITTALTHEGGFSLCITDSGPGIPPEHLGRIFNPFFTTKPPGKGTGLGLAITLRIVDRLGGTIAADNLPDRGARFLVTLPPPGRLKECKP